MITRLRTALNVICPKVAFLAVRAQDLAKLFFALRIGACHANSHLIATSKIVFKLLAGWAGNQLGDIIAGWSFAMDEYAFSYLIFAVVKAWLFASIAELFYFCLSARMAICKSIRLAGELI